MYAFTVLITDQCNICCSVRIVFDTDYFCCNIIFSSLEVNDSVFSSASTSAVSDSDFTLVVTTRIFLQGYYQRFFRCCFCDFRETEPVICLLEGVYGLKCLNSHCCFSFRCLLSRFTCVCCHVCDCALCLLRYVPSTKLYSPSKSRYPCCLLSEQRLLFFCFSSSSDFHAAALFLAIHVHGINAFTSVPSNIFSTASLIIVLFASRVNKKCIFLFSHCIHTFFSVTTGLRITS